MLYGNGLIRRESFDLVTRTAHKRPTEFTVSPSVTKWEEQQHLDSTKVIKPDRWVLDKSKISKGENIQQFRCNNIHTIRGKLTSMGREKGCNI